MQEYWKDRKNKNIVSFAIYIVLVLSIFSDILRVPGSTMTFFRLGLPFAIGILMLYPYWFSRFFLIILGLALLSVVQYILLFGISHVELDLSVNNFMRYMFFYSCMILVFFLVKLLQINNTDTFEKNFSTFLIGAGVILTGIIILYNILSKAISGLQLDNPNNYACCLSALFPFLLIKLYGKKKFQYLILTAVVFFVLIYSDAKAALFGCILQVGIFFALVFQSESEKKILHWRFLIIGIGIFVLFGILVLNPQIHGYSMRGTILEPILRVIHNDPYPIYTTSITFRTNTTIFAVWELIQTAGIGVGIGNTGILLKNTFTALNPEYQQAANASVLSLHNAWLEFALDIGIPAIIFYIVVLSYVFKLYFKKPNLTQIEKIRVIYTLTFPIWVLGPSGVYTLYFLLLTMAFLLFADKDVLITGSSLETKGE